MNKEESYKTYMILMIYSDGNQNVFFIFACYRSPFCQVFGLPLSASLSIEKFVESKEEDDS